MSRQHLPILICRSLQALTFVEGSLLAPASFGTGAISTGGTGGGGVSGGGGVNWSSPAFAGSNATGGLIAVSPNSPRALLVRPLCVTRMALPLFAVA